MLDPVVTGGAYVGATYVGAVGDENIPDAGGAPAGTVVFAGATGVAPPE